MSELRIVDRTKDRYHSLAISSVWELEKLRAARVLVVGCGALGNEVSKNLAMMGVKVMVVLDRDTIEVANLSRSVFFREQDHGQSKATVITERLRDLNSDVEVVTIDGDLDLELGLGVVRRMDLVFSCLDSRLARRSLSRKCEKVGKPWVDGSMEDLLGEVAVFTPGSGPCYECGLSQQEKLRIAEAASCRGIALRNLSLGKVPTTSTMGSIIAALQVQEGIRILHGDMRNAQGKRLIVNCNLNDVYYTSSERDPGCEGHDTFGEVIEVPEFTAAETSGFDLLTRFKEATGEEGFVELGRETVLEFHCTDCERIEASGKPVSAVEEIELVCTFCGGIRELKTTHVIKPDDGHAAWPLAALAIPRLEILEVRGRNFAQRYELTGDAESFGFNYESSARLSNLVLSA